MTSGGNGERWTIGDGTAWSFFNGRWADGAAGEILPREEERQDGVVYDDQSRVFLAVRHDRWYGNFSATFRFQSRSGHGGVRLLFRLQDLGRYYALDIPWCGQQARNRHMWAGLVIADGTPLQRYVQFGLIREVVPRTHHWYEARVECAGSRIRAWIEGRQVVDVEDATYDAGRLGIMGITPAGHHCVADFADLQVEGAYQPPRVWKGLTPLPPHWVTPCPETDPETYQGYPSIIRSASGLLTAGVPFHNPGGPEEPRYIKWVRSRDHGRTWSKPEPATLHKAFGANFVKQDGTWVTLYTRPGARGSGAFYTYTSRDDGRTWQGPHPLSVTGEWPDELTEAGPSGQPLRLRDGTLLVPIMCQREFCGYVNATVSTNYVLRSTDDGQTWEAPVWCDANNSREALFCVGNFSEIGLAEAQENVVIGYGRPGPWPYMWRVQSNDGGKTWEPAALGAFPGYCSTLTRTASGALVAVHRFPYLGANVSWDNGITWDAGTILDYPLWANHQALEVEPDVVLVNYMGYLGRPGQADRRVLRLRATPSGLVVDP